VALVATAVGWLQAPDGITGAEAVTAARGAFAAAGLGDGVVRPQAEPGDYPTGSGRSPIPVWRTFADVAGGTVELWLARSDGESVFLDDRTPDGTAQLLSAEQFEVLADHYENPALGRQVRRNLVLTAAAALIAFVAATIAHDPVALHLRRDRAAAPARPPEPPSPPVRPGPTRRDRPLRPGPARRDRPLRPGPTHRDRPLRSPLETT
jgi:hypothetical protein